MAAMKVTTSAAMRARDVSRPHAEHLATAEAAEARAASSRPAGPAVPLSAPDRASGGPGRASDAPGRASDAPGRASDAPGRASDVAGPVDAVGSGAAPGDELLRKTESGDPADEAAQAGAGRVRRRAGDGPGRADGTRRRRRSRGSRRGRADGRGRGAS